MTSDDCFVLTIRLAPVAFRAFLWNGKSSPRQMQQKLVIQAGSFEGGFQRVVYDGVMLEDLIASRFLFPSRNSSLRYWKD